MTRPPANISAEGSAGGRDHRAVISGIIGLPRPSAANVPGSLWTLEGHKALNPEVLPGLQATLFSLGFLGNLFPQGQAQDLQWGGPTTPIRCEIREERSMSVVGYTEARRTIRPWMIYISRGIIGGHTRRGRGGCWYIFPGGPLAHCIDTEVLDRAPPTINQIATSATAFSLHSITK